MYDDLTRRDGAAPKDPDPRPGVDRASFVEGYKAAMGDLDGNPLDWRGGVMFDNPSYAANSAYNLPGVDWIAPIVRARLQEADEREERERLERRLQPKVPRPPADGTIYVFSDGNGRVKIGWTGKSVSARRSVIEKASGHTITVVATAPGTLLTERGFHERFTADRLNGEWFTRTSAIDAWIETL